jgi:hypothetical protein
MTPKRIVAIVLALSLIPALLHAQADESRINVFGYFQASFYQQSDLLSGEDYNSFTLQQLNLILQKDLRRRWSTFVNFEFTNSYSSWRNWGSFALEEAWLKYRHNRYLSLKLGLLIPKYNHMNEIKNRTPLLPYIIRPLVYETSFQEIFPVSEFVPEQAYVEVYGHAPIKSFKFDYAAYWGNGPNTETNVGDDYSSYQSGLDTTSTFLFGLRIGVRHPNFRFGISTTADKLNFFAPVDTATGGTSPEHHEAPRYRGGVDIGVELWNIDLTSELFTVKYDHTVLQDYADKSFFFVTLGYTFREKLFTYISIWEMKWNEPDSDTGEYVEVKMEIPGIGVAYEMSDNVKLKASISSGKTKTQIQAFDDEFKFFALAVSVAF